jgi:polyferredoxin
MRRIKKPEGLIRYSSQDALDGKPHSWLRARTLIYPMLILTTATLFLVMLSTKFSFDAKIIPSPGVPYSVLASRTLQNNFRVRLTNRTSVPEKYTIEMLEPATAVVHWSDVQPELGSNESKLLPIVITAPVGLTAGKGNIKAVAKITDSANNSRLVSFRMSGP